MQKRFQEYILNNEMIQAGDVVVAGVSGGADSVCLLYLLSEYAKSADFSLHCVHIHHGIRQTAERDAEYVRNLCNRLQIPCTVIYKDVPAMAREQARSLEEAGREARYAAFAEVLQQELHNRNLPSACGKIAVAHTQNDNAETMLFNLFRGSNLKGLGGIRPVRDCIIRPLLCMNREEIEQYLTEHQLTWMEDETNSELTYTRNIIRHSLMPVICEQISPGAISNLMQEGCRLQETEDYLALQTKEAMQRCVTIGEDGMDIDADAFYGIHPLLQKRILYGCMEQIAGRAKDITSTHVDVFLSVFSLQVGKSVSLPYKMQAVRTYRGVRLSTSGKPNVNMDVSEKSDAGSNKGTPVTELRTDDDTVDSLGNTWRTELFAWEKNTDILQKTYTKWIDYDKITKCLVLRTRQIGDYLIINDRGGRQSLKSYFINEKIEVGRRDEMLLVADGNEIVWIPGYRLNARYKISDNTKRVLKIYAGGNEDE